MLSGPASMEAQHVYTLRTGQRTDATNTVCHMHLQAQRTTMVTKVEHEEVAKGLAMVRVT